MCNQLISYRWLWLPFGSGHIMRIFVNWLGWSVSWRLEYKVLSSWDTNISNHQSSLPHAVPPYESSGCLKFYKLLYVVCHFKWSLRGWVSVTNKTSRLNCPGMQQHNRVWKHGQCQASISILWAVTPSKGSTCLSNTVFMTGGDSLARSHMQHRCGSATAAGTQQLPWLRPCFASD